MLGVPHVEMLLLVARSEIKRIVRTAPQTPLHSVLLLPRLGSLPPPAVRGSPRAGGGRFGMRLANCVLESSGDAGSTARRTHRLR